MAPAGCAGRQQATFRVSHSRDARAYDVPAGELDACVAERIAAVKAGDPNPRDLMLASGEVVRFQCAVLPDGGRMLSYTYVTDIKRSASEADQLRAAFDALDTGIIVLDSGLRAVLVNRAARLLWSISDEQAGRHPAYTEFVHRAFTASGTAGKPRLPEGETATHLARAIAGDPTPTTLSLSDGEVMRARCTALPDGSRLLAYERIPPQRTNGPRDGPDGFEKPHAAFHVSNR